MTAKTSWHVALLGGFKGEGRWRMDAHTVVVTLVGGADLDLREADLATTDPVVTKISLVGGVKVTVPPGVSVDVTGVSLFGGRSVQAPVDQSAQTRVHIRSYGIFGGVKVQTSAR
jgi:predicted membrane protein